MAKRHTFDSRAGEIADAVAAGGHPSDLLSDTTITGHVGHCHDFFAILRSNHESVPDFVMVGGLGIRTSRRAFVKWLRHRQQLFDTGYAGHPSVPRGRPTRGSFVYPTEVSGDAA